MTAGVTARIIDPPPPLSARLSMIDLRTARLPATPDELSPHERSRAARLNPVDRRRYEAAHCALRDAIGKFIGLAPRRIDFAVGQYGKPALANDIDCRFSLSRCGDWALIAVTHRVEIGVDLERVRRIDDVEELAADYLHPHEHAALLACAPGPARDREFLLGWTRKEACVKAVGYGLSIPTDDFFSGVGTGTTQVAIALEGGGVTLLVSGLTGLPTGFVAALATVVGDQ